MNGGIWWLASYPKSGNTWLRAWLRNLQLDADVPAELDDLGLGPLASSREWFEDVLGLDSDELPSEQLHALRPRLYRWAAAQAGTPLYCKAHDIQARLDDGDWLFPPEASRGAVYLIRNPLDVVVSLARHMGCDLDEAIFRLGSPGHVIAARGGDDQLRQHLSDWSSHILAWTEQSVLPVMPLRYEDMHAHPLASLQRVASFLGLSQEPARLERAVRHAEFAVLKQQEARTGFREASAKAGPFFHTGRPSAWREALSPAQVERVVTRHGEAMRRFGYLNQQGPI